MWPLLSRSNYSEWAMLVQCNFEALEIWETIEPGGASVKRAHVRIDGPRGGGELGLFQILKRSKATLTYAKLVRHQFTNRITKLSTQAKKRYNEK